MAPTPEGAPEIIAELEKRIARLEKILLGSSAVSVKSPFAADSRRADDHAEVPLPRLDLAATSGDHKSAIETGFPGIAEKLVLLWGHPECLSYLGKLIIDNRGNRKGFGLDVMDELVLLVEIAEQTNPEAWVEFIRLDNR